MPFLIKCYDKDSTSVVFMPKMYNVSLILRKYKKKSKLRDSPQNNCPLLFIKAKFKKDKACSKLSE